MRWLGALSSVAIVGGLSFWVYDLATRDAREVPVVMAMEGPSRAQPTEPGGFKAAHQGLSVNRISSKTIDSPLSERVVLAPDAIGVSEDDHPPESAEQADAMVGKAIDPDMALRLAVEGALTQVLGGDDTGATGQNAAMTTPRTLSGGTSIAPRPRPRPAVDVATRAASQGSLPALSARALDLDPTAIPAGTRLVQLGAYDSDLMAKSEWDRLSNEFEDYLAPKQRVIERAQVGDRVFYRLRAYGFDDLAEARNFCAVLMADSADCIPVLTR